MEWVQLVAIVGCVLGAIANSSHDLEEQLEVQCGMENMQIIVPQHLKGDTKMKVLNKDGKMVLLRNDPSCGIWVTQKYNNSVVIGTSYDGCYVYQTDAYFGLTLGFTTKQDGGKKVTLRKKMTCAVETYHDSPGPDQCNSVLPPNRLKCADSQEACASMGCCSDPSSTITPCYYGNKVTARCTPDGLFSIALSKTLTIPDLNLMSVQLLGSGSAECNPVHGNDFFLLFQFPISSCGTTLKMIGDQAVYENQLVATKTLQTWNNVLITRDSTFRVLVRCSYAVSGFLPLKVDVVTLPPPPPVSSPGPLEFELRIGQDPTYSRYYGDSDYPVVKVLRDPVFVEIRILQKSDPNLNIVLHQCWATRSTNPLDALQWPILVNGCPFAGDNYVTELIPIAPGSTVDSSTHYARFDVKTFTFLDQNTQESLRGQVYIHCSVSACVPTPSDNCATACFRSKRSAHLLRNESDSVLVSSDVPIYFEDSLPEPQNEREGVYGVRISQPEALIHGAAAAMGIFAVVLLMLTTWNLHRQRKSKSILISKSPSVMAKTVHVSTISSELVPI